MSPMKAGARIHHSYGSYAPSTYGSYDARKANPSIAATARAKESCTGLAQIAGARQARKVSGWPKRCKLAHAFLWVPAAVEG